MTTPPASQGVQPDTRTAAPTVRGVLPISVAALVYLASLFATPPDGPPVESATAAQIRAYLVTNGTALRVESLALAIAGVAVVVFAAGMAAELAARLAARQGRRRGSTPATSAPTGTVGPIGSLPWITLGAGVLLAGWHWLNAAAEGNSAVQALDGTALSSVDDAVLRSWYAGTNLTHLYGDVAMLAIALLLTASSWGSLRTGLLPRWVVVLGLLAAAAGAVGTVGVVLALPALANVWFGGLFGWTLWLPCMAVALLVRARRAAGPQDVDPPHAGSAVSTAR